MGSLQGSLDLPTALQLLSLSSIYLSAVSGFSSLTITLAILPWTNPPAMSVCITSSLSNERQCPPPTRENMLRERL